VEGTGRGRARREPFAMVPRRLLRRGEDGGPVCAHCAALFAVLDAEQGELAKGGRPWRGRNALVQALGWSRETVTEHVRHLVAAGLLDVRQAGRSMAVYVVANPSRLTPAVDGTPPGDLTPAVDGRPPGQVDGTPPGGGREAAHPHRGSGRDTAHRSRSTRSEPGLPPSGPRAEVSAVALLERSFGAVEVVDHDGPRCGGCGAPTEGEGETWCAGCAPF
jgi:biotin operon repressor